MSRTLRTTIPTTRTQRLPRVPDRDEVRTRDQMMKKRQKKNFDSHHGARTLPALQPGDRIWIPTRQKEGTVQSEVASRSLLKTDLNFEETEEISLNFLNHKLESRKHRLRESRTDQLPNNRFLNHKHLRNLVGANASLFQLNTLLRTSVTDFLDREM